MDVTLPSGDVVKGVPDDMTRDQFVQKAKANGMNIPDEWLTSSQAHTQAPQPAVQQATPQAAPPPFDPNDHTYRVGDKRLDPSKTRSEPNSEFENVLTRAAGTMVGMGQDLPQAAAAITSPQTLIRTADKLSGFMGMGTDPYGQTAAALRRQGVDYDPVPEWAKHGEGLSRAITNSSHAYTDYMGAVKDRVEASLTPSFRAAAEKPMREGIKDPEWYLNGVGTAAAYALPTVGPIATASRLGYAAKMASLAGENMEMDLKVANAMAAAHKAGAAVGGVTNAAIMGGQTGSEVRDALGKLDEATLMNYPEYRKSREQGKSDTEARQEFISSRANEATILAGVASELPTQALNSFVAHAAVGHAIARTTAGAALKGTLEGGTAGALGMTGMGTVERAEEAPDKDFYAALKKGGADDALTGALFGAVTGGSMAGGAHERIPTTQAEDLARASARAKTASDVQKAMQDQADAEAAQANEERHKAGTAADQDIGASARAEVKAERVTADKAQEAHETMARARADFVTAHERVKAIEAHVSDPSVPVNYNELEAARANRAHAYNEFAEAAKSAGVLTARDQAGKVQSNGATETEGSNGDRQRGTGAETNGLRDRDQREPGYGIERPGERSSERAGTERDGAGPSAPTPGREGNEREDAAHVEGPGRPEAGVKPGDGLRPGRRDQRPEHPQPLMEPPPAEKPEDEKLPDKQYATNFASIPASERTLTSDQKKVEGRMKAIVSDLPKAEADYAKVPGTQGGRVINTDLARELSPDYSKDNASRALHANSVQEPSSWLADQLFRRRLADEPGADKSVMFTAGGSGTEKSSSLSSKEAKKADIIYDGNMNNLPKTRRRIKATLDSGRTVHIKFFDRDPIESFRAVLKRAMEEGRTVPAEVHADTHNDSFKTVMAIAKQFAKDDRVKIDVVDVSNENVKTLQDVAKNHYEVNPKQLRDIAIEEYHQGKIDDTVLKGTAGEAALKKAKASKPKIESARPEPGKKEEPARPEPGAHTGDQVERRSDSARRERVAKMSPAEMRRELLTNELTGLPNRRAFEEDKDAQKPVQAALDVNSLKWHNDIGGHDTGDVVLKKVASALKVVAKEHGVRAYHISGDEFRMQGDSREKVEAAIRDAKAALAKEVVKGGGHETHGITFAHGIADTPEEADRAVQPEKDRQERIGERAGRGEIPPNTYTPLEGMPTTIEVNGKQVEFGPLPAARKAAEDYAKRTGREYSPPRDYKKVNVERAREIAKAYDEMKHAPDDPKVKASYDAMIKETLDQFQDVKKTGLKIEFIKPGQADPYASSPRLAIMDARDNKHLWVFPTDQGFGHGNEFQNHPLMRETDEVVDGRKLLANDVFRIVHDYFGHIKEGNGFRADGEENAWRQHAAMYSDLARGAMTSETRGQNSWLNFGPQGEKNRTAKSADTVYADQKAGLLPEKFWNDTDDKADQSYRVKSLAFRHFSKLADEAVTLDPKFYGKGIRGAEKSRIDAGAPKVISAYASDHPDSRIESGLRGLNEYRIEVPASKVYDLSRDPEEILERAVDKQGNYDHTKAEKLIKDAGYLGYHLPQAEGAFKGQARFFDKVKATRVRTQRERVNLWGGKPEDIPYANTKHERDVIASGGIDSGTAEAIQRHIKAELGFDVIFANHPRDVPLH